jgi:NADH dehydrogenase (ubiquinone) Fe-S protein 1
LKYDHIENSVYGKISNKEYTENQSINENEPFVDLIDNYYMTDAISRNSITMAKCSTAFNPVKLTNFKKIRQTYAA